MKKSLLFTAAVCAALAVSCNETILEETELVQEPSQSEEMITLTCSLPETKVSIDAAGKTAWVKDDVIYVHGGSDEHTTVTLTDSDISADGKTATISFSGITKYSGSSYKSSYYMIYPADAAGASHTMYYETRFNKFTEPVIGGYDDGAGHFITKNLCSVIRYKITTGDFDTYTFEGKNGETVGYEEYQVRLALNADDTIDYRKTWKNGYAGNGTALTLTSVSGSVVTDGTYNYLVIPGGVSFSGGFIFKFKNGGTTVKTLSTSSSFSLTEGDLLDLGDVTGNLKDFVAPSVSTHESTITGATDLSTANGPANCYVISAPGAYKLPVVKGNNNVISPGNVFGVEILWETYNNAETVTANSVIAAVDFDGPTNYVYFETPATLKPGNALIAAKDYDGNILWSWHIWIPETAIQYYDYGIHTSGKLMMDRNLGALDVPNTSAKIDVNTVGLFYQWGRKDPFPGPRSLDSEGSYVSFAKVAGTSPSTSKIQLSVEESLKNPTLFARGYYDGDTQKNPDWCSTADASLWGDGSTKSIYDPCPPGYRVPNRDRDYSLWKNDLTDSATGWSYDKDQYWFTLGGDGSSIPAAIFPCAGYNDGGSSKTTFRTIIWNAHSNDYTNTYGYSHYSAYARRVRYESSALKFNNDSVNKSLGGSVRCVAE